MNTIEIEVMTINYMGKLTVEPINNNYSSFVIYINNQILGLLHPAKKQNITVWYSHEITDKELVAQIGEWLEFYYPLTEGSFKKIYRSNFFSEIWSVINHAFFADLFLPS